MDATSYERVILKLSGQSLAGTQDHGFCADTLRAVAAELLTIQREGIELGIVIGGGNLFRGASTLTNTMNRADGDGIGMLATIMNCLALQSVLNGLGGQATVFSALPVGPIADLFSRRKAVAALSRGEIVLLGGGTGNPFFTTDSAAALRACELEADALLKATRVDGIYDRDPEIHEEAVRFERISYETVIEKRLAVMDTAAFTLCRDHGIPIVVFNVHTPGNMLRAASGENVGSVVTV